MAFRGKARALRVITRADSAISVHSIIKLICLIKFVVIWATSKVEASLSLPSPSSTELWQWFTLFVDPFLARRRVRASNPLLVGSNSLAEYLGDRRMLFNSLARHWSTFPVNI